jgi:hypothetical protein
MILDIISSHTKIKISFLIIFVVGLTVRFFYFPYDLPLVIDGMDNFTYATAINYYGHLPTEWSPPNNGWPIFLSFWFSIINLDNSLQYMQLQRIISVVLSSLIVIPVYFLCKKFFDEKISLVGAALFAFDPRIILNSLLGITEPLFILLGISSLVFFLRYRNREIILSFILAAFCTIVRSEGMFLFFTLTILFFIRYRFSREVLKTYIPSLLIFFIILSPIMNYRIEVTGYDGIFQRAAYGTGQILSNSGQEGTNHIINGIELFIKYLGWIMIPNFLVFLPFGAIQFLRKRTSETNFIIIFVIMSSLPILYAYIVQAQDTRYFYFLYPIFSLISLFAVKTYLEKFSKKDFAVMLIIVGILAGSIAFYEYKKIDYEKEKELNEIAEIASKIASGLNFHPSETRYIRAAELPREWPFLFYDETHKIKSIPTTNYEDLGTFIGDSRNELTHLIVDDDPRLPKFLQEVYYNENKYEYLSKVFDSREMGFKHQVKIFEINFQKFDSNNRR